MGPLTVRHEQTTIVLDGALPFTFGRDPNCELQIGDGTDRGISRTAGALTRQAGCWWLSNLSTTRAFHVLDDTGYLTPLPVRVASLTPPRRPIFAPGVTVILTGETFSYAIYLETEQPAVSSYASALPVLLSDSKETFRQPILTAKRKRALVAVLNGYLQPFPRYDPRPLSYADAAKIAGVPASTIRKRLEDVKAALREVGVPGLDGNDAPWRMAEWVLATRMVTPDDLKCLEHGEGGRW